MEKTTLTDFYKSRQQTETAFSRECTQLLTMLKERYKEIRLIDIAISSLKVNTKRPSLLYYVIVLFNMKSRQSVFLRVQCNSAIYCKNFVSIPQQYQNAEQLLQPRFEENYVEDAHETQVSLKRLIVSQQFPFEELLQIERPEPVLAS